MVDTFENHPSFDERTEKGIFRPFYIGLRCVSCLQ